MEYQRFRTSYLYRHAHRAFEGFAKVLNLMMNNLCIGQKLLTNIMKLPLKVIAKY